MTGITRSIYGEPAWPWPVEEEPVNQLSSIPPKQSVRDTGQKKGEYRLVERLLVDGHVHVHDSYDETTFLSAAYTNLSQQGEGLATLLLAEMQGANVFARWKAGGAPWTVAATGEPSAIVLGNKLLVIAGRQIVTAEKIEVLAQLTSESFEDGLPLRETIDRALALGALVVLPWGVGKWLGARGRLITQALVQWPVLLGDNAGRPMGWPTPAIFRDHVVLPGTDPLRMRSQQCAVGSYGFAVTGPFDLVHPVAGLARELRKMAHNPQCFGRRVGWTGFLRQQTALRISK